jgi:hypothetical protein
MEAGSNDPNNNEQMRKALDILTGRDTDLDEQPEGEERAEDGKPKDKGPKAKPKTIAEAAERLGLKLEELYGLEVSVADGNDAEKFTVGALKDAMKERTDHKLEQIRWGEEKANQEGELMRSRNELTELMQLLPPGSLKPEVLAKVREKHDATLKLERERIFQVIPEWKDEAKRGADLDAMREHLERSGFPKGYLNNVSDHKTFRYIRENMLREQRITQALALVKPKAPKSKQAPSTSGSTTKGPRMPTGVQRGNSAEGQKVSAVKDILRGLTPNI